MGALGTGISKNSVTLGEADPPTLTAPEGNPA